ncbi:unnamed protein product [Orchesella dallaii]|uniref:Uncharacterized protein n=1 Tax=Orchesella dallaii TaxID=48710 RepID=A0ABP1PJ38_9HEXA
MCGNGQVTRPDDKARLLGRLIFEVRNKQKYYRTNSFELPENVGITKTWAVGQGLVVTNRDAQGVPNLVRTMYRVRYISRGQVGVVGNIYLAPEFPRIPCGLTDELYYTTSQFLLSSLTTALLN